VQFKINISLILISLIMILASVRGALVFHLGFHAYITYAITALMLISLGIFSFFKMHNSKSNGELVFLKNAVTINFIFGIYFTIATILLTKQLDPGFMYTFFIYPVVFVLIKFKRQWLDFLVYFITAVTVFGVILFLQIGISGGFDAIEAANLTVRPGELSYSRIGNNLLPAGYQGDHHDAANILVMCDVLFLTKFILCERRLLKYLYLVLFGITFMVVVSTGSSANIIILIGVSGLALGFVAKRNVYLFSIYVSIGLFFFLLLFDSIANYFYFIDNISQDQSTLEGGGIFNSLNLHSFISSIPSILFGFSSFLNAPLQYSEVAFVKILISYGIAPFLIQIFILLSPVYYWLVLKKNYKTIDYSIYDDKRTEVGLVKKTRTYLLFKLAILGMPSLAGMLTLLHYGSLLRVTSVGLFCLLLAIYFKEYLQIRYSKISN
jgi:hypothetical protein